jgi:imidazolonepropionase-like amidohydrolase
MESVVKHLRGALLVAAVIAAPLPGQQAVPALVISDVTVIPMSGVTSVPRATVVVQAGRITAVHTGTVPTLPAGAIRIDGRGKFLIPGLTDMHAHLYADEWVPDSVAPYELGVYLAHGVTTARMMIGTPVHLQLRRDLRAGRLLSPTLFVASPHLTGDGGKNSLMVRTPEEARIAVRHAADSGYDFVKLTTNITPEVFDAVVAEARARRIRVVGHVDPRVGVARALAAGQQIEHLDNYMESVLADSAPSRQSVSDVGAYRAANWNSLLHVDMKKVDAIAGATARAGVYVTPTLGFFSSWFATRTTDAEVTGRPDFAHIPPAMREGYLRARTAYWRNPPSDELRARYLTIRRHMVRAIVDSGGKIMAGSDGPGGLQGYGWMMHRELEALVDAGLTPLQALAAATTVPAEFLGTTAESGTVTAGKRADLVLLAANPLEDIRNTARIEGVVVGGQWLDRARLEAMIEAARVRLNP